MEVFMTKKDPKWRKMKYGENIVVSKLVAEYNLFSLDVFPYTHCKARIWHESEDFYLALSNIEIKIADDRFDGTSGHGKTEQEALNKLIENLLSLISYYEIKWNRKLESEDYNYLDPDDF